MYEEVLRSEKRFYDSIETRLEKLEHTTSLLAEQLTAMSVLLLAITDEQLHNLKEEYR